MKTNRRDFLQTLSLAFGSILLMPACSGNTSFLRFFTDKEARTIIAFTEQLIPADKDPGATDANVINFIDKQLMGHYSRFQTEYRKGLSALEGSVQKLFQSDFPDLEWEKQTAFMKQMEKGKLPEEFWTEINQSSFFALVLSHCMQGFYGAPRHGGNKNYVSYKMMRLDYPHVLGQNRY